MLDELFSPSDQKLATHSNSRHRLAANRSMS
jgi:hypothetical protein